VQRQLSTQLSAVGGVAIAGARLSPKILHLTPSDARHGERLIGGCTNESISASESYTERILLASANCFATFSRTAYDPAVLNCLK
jgi:hypothetical protein